MNIIKRVATIRPSVIQRVLTADISRVILLLFSSIIFAFLLAPIIVVIIVSFNPSHITFPPEGFSLHWYLEILARKDFLHAARVSFMVASVAALLSTFIGTLGSLALVRYEFRGRDTLSLLFLSPLLVPAVVVALALYQLVFILGGSKSFTFLLIGHVLITIPFPVRTILAVLQGFDRSLEEAGMSVGANEIQVFFKITLPLIKPGVIAGAIFAFIMSWNDFTMSVFLAGPGFITLPIRIYTYIEYEYKPILAAISTVLVGQVLFFLEKIFCS